MDNGSHIQWQGRTSGGRAAHNSLVGILRYLPVSVVYFFMPPVALWLFFAHSEERRSILRYFRRILGYGPVRSLWMALKNHLAFGMTIIDRFAVYAKGMDIIKVDIDREGNDFIRLCRKEHGIIIASAHIGNFEIGGYSLRQEFKKIHVFSFSGEENALQSNRQDAFGEIGITMESSSGDLTDLMKIKNILDGGDVVAMLCDRFISDEKSREVTVMGRSAFLPDGMFRIAEKLDIPVVSFFIVRTGCLKYKAYIRELCPDHYTEYRRGERSEALLNEYISDMEHIIALYPEQWFNYFDFWNYAD